MPLPFLERIRPLADHRTFSRIKGHIRGRGNQSALNEEFCGDMDSDGGGQPPAIDPPQPGIDQTGFIDHLDGANLRTGPEEFGGRVLTSKPLPPGTRVFVSGSHPEAPAWWYVTAFLPDMILRGYVQEIQPHVSRVNTDLPEPSAKLYLVKPNDNVEMLARREFSASVQDGHDLRYYENVLLSVNKDKGRVGITGTHQQATLFNAFTGGPDNIQLVAGHLIWLVSPTYARQLQGLVPSGSLTGGQWAKAQRGMQHISDILRSVTRSPEHFGAVAGEYAKAILDHLPQIVGITAGFLAAESASMALAISPTGVGQLVAVVIQLALAAFGAQGAIDAGVQALEHGRSWLTLAWTAKGDDKQISEASREFLRMLVSVAMAALAVVGTKGNLSKGLKIAEAIKIQLPRLGMSPALGTPNGAVLSGGPIFTPGSITSTGPVDINLSMSTGAGYVGSRLRPGYNPSERTEIELKRDLEPTPQPGETAEQAQARTTAAKDELAFREMDATFKALGETPPKIDLAKNDAAFPRGHTIEKHGPDVPLRRTDAAPGQRTIEGRLFGDPPWKRSESNSYRWTDASTMNRTTNEYLAANWNKIRNQLVVNQRYEDTFTVPGIVGEGFSRQNGKVLYRKTSMVTLRLRLSPGNPPRVEVLTTFPNGRGR